MNENNSVFNLNIRDIEYGIKHLSEKQQINAIANVLDKFKKLDNKIDQDIKAVNKKARTWKTLTIFNIVFGVLGLLSSFFNIYYLGICLATLLMGFSAIHHKNIHLDKKDVLVQAKGELAEKINYFEKMYSDIVKKQENITVSAKESINKVDVISQKQSLNLEQETNKSL